MRVYLVRYGHAVEGIFATWDMADSHIKWRLIDIEEDTGYYPVSDFTIDEQIVIGSMV